MLHGRKGLNRAWLQPVPWTSRFTKLKERIEIHTRSPPPARRPARLAVIHIKEPFGLALDGKKVVRKLFAPA